MPVWAAANRRPSGMKKGKDHMSKRFALVALAAVVGAAGLATSGLCRSAPHAQERRCLFRALLSGSKVYAVEPGQQVAFDESYYDPYYLPPSKKSKKAKKAQRARAKAEAIAAAREAEAKAKAAKLAKAKPAASEEITGSTSKIKTASVAPETTKKTATAAVTCEKATSIISGYGFATVEATKCAAPTYEFKAKRDGKDFLIKVSSASGELTEVKKLN